MALFLVITIILLLSVSLIFFLKENSTKEFTTDIRSTSLEILPITNYVESCIESVGKDSIIWIGQHGGYFELPNYAIESYQKELAYYFHIDSDIMPSKEEIEKELSKYVDEKIPACINDFIDFKKQGFEIKQGKIKVNTLIKQRNVLFQMDFPLTIKKGEKETKLSSFSNSVKNIRLNTIYEVSKKIIEKQMRNANSLCLSCLLNLSLTNGLSINLNKQYNNTIIITIDDFHSDVDSLPYKFIFANKYEIYSCSNMPADPDNDFLLNCLDQEIEKLDYELYINDVPDMVVFVNQTFYYKIDATGLNISFIDYSKLFNISEKTGIISFEPKISQIGSHDVWINVKDQIGNEKYLNFILNITEKNE